MSKNPLDEILSELVVFRNGATGEYQSNSPYWQDARIRKAWKARYSDEALVAAAEEPEDEEEVEEVDYTTLTNDQLRTELAARKLSVDGNKAELIARLEESDAQEG
jgi:hypothetical protein